MAVVLVLLCGCKAFGVYHTVKPGETLWSISRAYGVSLTDLERANDITDPTRLQAGEQLFVPFAEEVQEDTTQAPDQPPAKAASTAGASGGAAATRPGKPATRPTAAPGRFIWPVDGVVTSTFGSRWGRVHNGIDIAAPEGTPILASAAGAVIFSASDQQGYGNLIIIQHGEYITVYAHCQTRHVGEGETVKQGQLIGSVGRSGRATGTHLHFETRLHKQPVDPLSLLPPMPR